MVAAHSRILIEPISREAYSPYGSLIAADESVPFRLVNMATAKRFNHLAEVANLRADSAKLNLCVFRCSPLTEQELEIKLLEKHQFSTQVFLPMSSDAKFLVIVCLGKDKPDLSTLKAFEASNSQGISYYPGVWHYPITAVGRQVDFACLVHEDDTANDCEIFNLDPPIEIVLEV